MLKPISPVFKNITYGQLRSLLTGLGFEEVRRPEGTALKHRESNTILLFRIYRDTDFVKPMEVYHVRQILDDRSLLDAEAFDGRLTKTPA
jgi:hypothetical protein